MNGYWWNSDARETFWVEIRKRPGTGVDLNCPLTRRTGERSGPYDLVAAVRPDDVVYHWHAEQSRFIGRSIVATDPTIETNRRVVRLRDFNPLVGDVNLRSLRQVDRELYAIRDRLKQKYPEATLHLPFQFRRDGIRMVNYYFAKLPREVVQLLFGNTGWADSQAEAPPTEDGPPQEPENAGVVREYLQPFRPKADVEYEVEIKGAIAKRGRTHETLVNDFSKYLMQEGLTPGRNRAVDIGLKEPPVIVEAKIVRSWPHAIREAIGQLYEYRYFEVASAKTNLVFLASMPVPARWRDYLEKDRGIGVAWRDGTEFHFTRRATRALGLRSAHNA